MEKGINSLSQPFLLCLGRARLHIRVARLHFDELPRRDVDT